MRREKWANRYSKANNWVGSQCCLPKYFQNSFADSLAASSLNTTDLLLFFGSLIRALLAQPVQDIPVMSFPRSRDAVLGERGQIEKRKNHFIKLFFVVIHAQ